MDTAYIVPAALMRGYARGDNDALLLAEKDHSPLSGEWAGESMTELLGDLIALAENDDHADEVCLAYERGYSAGYDHRTSRMLLK